MGRLINYGNVNKTLLFDLGRELGERLSYGKYLTFEFRLPLKV